MAPFPHNTKNIFFSSNLTSMGKDNIDTLHLLTCQSKKKKKHGEGRKEEMVVFPHKTDYTSSVGGLSSDTTTLSPPLWLPFSQPSAQLHLFSSLPQTPGIQKTESPAGRSAQMMECTGGHPVLLLCPQGIHRLRSTLRPCRVRTRVKL